MKKKLVTLLLAGILALSVTACGDESSNSSNDTTEPSKEETTDTENTKSQEETEPEQVIAPYETDLTCGYYVAGVHFPEGVYNLTVNSGLGNILTKSGVTSALGTGSGVEYAQSFDNLTLQNGDVLTVTQSLNIHLTTDEAYYSSMTAYDNPATEEKELSAGNYVIGQDIPAGLYDVSIVDGTIVNVNTDTLSVSTALTNDETLKSSTATTCKNAELIDGQTLTVSSGTIKLTPCADNEPLSPQ